MGDHVDQIWRKGDRCIYNYRGAHCMEIEPQRFEAKVKGTTAMGRVRIDARCPVTGWFSAVVKPESLEHRQDAN